MKIYMVGFVREGSEVYWHLDDGWLTRWVDAANAKDARRKARRWLSYVRISGAWRIAYCESGKEHPSGVWRAVGGTINGQQRWLRRLNGPYKGKKQRGLKE